MREAHAVRVVAAYEERFWSKVKRLGPDECWLWSGHRWPKGYGAFKDYGGSLNPASRVAFVMEVGEIPPGMVVMHTCDNPPCVNPRHLIAGTPQENNRDRDIKGRQVSPRGEKHSHSSITNDTARVIKERLATGERQSSVADGLRVSRNVVGQIARGRTWKHVT